MSQMTRNDRLAQAQQLEYERAMRQKRMLLEKRVPNASEGVKDSWNANIERDVLMDAGRGYGTPRGAAANALADKLRAEREATTGYRQNMTNATRGSEIAVAAQPQRDSDAMERMRRIAETGGDIRNLANRNRVDYEAQDADFNKRSGDQQIEDAIANRGIRTSESGERIRTSQTNRDIATDQNMSSLARQNIERDLLKRGGSQEIDIQRERANQEAARNDASLRRFVGLTPSAIQASMGEAQMINAQARRFGQETNPIIQRAQADAEMARLRNERFGKETAPFIRKADSEADMMASHVDRFGQETSPIVQRLQAEADRFGQETAPLIQKAQAEADFANYNVERVKRADEAERNTGFAPGALNPRQAQQRIEQRNALIDLYNLGEQRRAQTSDALSALHSQMSSVSRGDIVGSGFTGSAEDTIGIANQLEGVIADIERLAAVDPEAAADQARQILEGLPIAGESGEYGSTMPVGSFAAGPLTLFPSIANVNQRREAAKRLTDIRKKAESLRAPRRIPPARGE